MARPASIPAFVIVAALSLSSCVMDRAADLLTKPRRADDGDYWVGKAQVRPQDFDVIATDGTRLSCLELFPRAGIRKRGTVYLFHGLGNSKEQMLPTAKRLCSSGFRCIAWDSRGHGKSGGSRASYGAHEVADALQVISAARKRDHGKRGSEMLWGFSMGTAVALQTLPYLPDVKGAVLLAPIADLGGVIRHQAAGHYHGVLRPFLPLVRARIRSTAGFDPQAIRPVDAVKLTKAKLLLIHGEQDEAIPIDQSRKIVAAGKPGQVRLLTLTDFSHQAIMWDLPENIRSEATRFLELQAETSR